MSDDSIKDDFSKVRPDSLQGMIDSITPDVYLNLKNAVETGRWLNGDRLTLEQLELSMQAIIGWELTNLPEEERTGYINTDGLKTSHCDTPGHSHEERPVTWIDSDSRTTH